jgi:hypothetical protein
MTPREALDVLRGLVEAGKRVGAAKRFPMPRGLSSYLRDRLPDKAIACREDPPWAFGSDDAAFNDRQAADFYIAAANARPALETLAGCVVLSVEDAKAVMRLLDSLATFAAINGRCGSMPDACASMRMSASIAEAEEAMR